MKERSFENPFLFCSCVCSCGALLWTVWGLCYLVFGEVLSSCIFHWFARWVAPQPSAHIAHQQITNDDSTAMLVRHFPCLVAASLFVAVPPAVTSTSAFAWHLQRTLGQRRLERFLPTLRRLTLPWCFAYLCFLFYLSRHWHRQGCVSLGKAHEALCSGTMAGAHKLQRLCRRFAMTECLFAEIVLYILTLTAFASFLGALLCLLGLWAAQSSHEARWTTPKSSREHEGGIETQPLLCK
uniref:Transmembrane protein n=1 Tax=Noctiluca scintillans TaxID=2966 RepID=A0A7S0ZV15_NOCSC